MHSEYGTLIALGFIATNYVCGFPCATEEQMLNSSILMCSVLPSHLYKNIIYFKICKSSEAQMKLGGQILVINYKIGINVFCCLNK